MASPPGKVKEMPGKALLFVPSGKSPMPGVWTWINRTSYVDKLIIRNFQKDTADEIAMQFFFSRDEYDYFIITTDDVVGHQFQVRHLLAVEEQHGYPIISGWCNHVKLWASLCIDPIDPKILEEALGKPFPGLELNEYGFAICRDIVSGIYGFPFVESWFTGMPLTLIRKETLKEVPFRGWRRWKDKFCVTPEAKKAGRGVMQDVQWAIDCAEKGIPITTDARIFLLHVFNTRALMRIGRKPHVEFIPAVREERTPEELAELDALLEEIAISAWKERKLTRKD